MKENSVCFFDMGFDDGCCAQGLYHFKSSGRGGRESLPFEEQLGLGMGERYDWRGNTRGLPGQQLHVLKHGSLR